MRQTVVDAEAVVVQAEQSCEEILTQMQEYINGFASRYQQAIDGVAAQELQSISNVNEVAEEHIQEMDAIKAQVTSDKTVVAGDKAIVQQTKANIETLKGDIGNLVAAAQAAASQASAPTITVGNKLYTQSVIVRRGKRFLKTVEVVPEGDGTETGGEA